MVTTLLHKANTLKKEGIRYIIAIVFISLMAATSEWIGEKEIIFPEVAALALGLLVIDKRIWSVSRPMIVVLMTLSSLFGVLVTRVSPLPLLANIGLSFIFTSSCLYLSRTTLIPITSASMLPIVLNTTSVVYPISVVVLSVVIVAVQWIMEILGLRGEIKQERNREKYDFSLRRWAMMFVSLLLIVFLPIREGCKYMIVPPLVVMFIEFCTSSAGFRLRGLQIYVIMVASAIIGSFFQYYVHNLLGISLVWSVCLMFICIFWVFRLLGKSFAPACAIALVPAIINQNDVLMYPLEVAVGAFAFLAVSLLCFLKCYRWKKEQLIYSFVPSFVRQRLLYRPQRGKSRKHRK